MTDTHEVASGNVYEFSHLETGTIRIEIQELDDPELELWNFEVVSVDYETPDETNGVYWEGRTVGCRIKETVLQSESHNLVSGE